MPCKTEEPSPIQQEGQLVGELLLYVYCMLGIKPSTTSIAISKEYFAKTSDVHSAVEELCTLLRNLNNTCIEDYEKVVYDAKSKNSRRLADWWEKHQEMDARRMEQELQEEKQRGVNRIFKKLTPEDISTLRKYWGL